MILGYVLVSGICAFALRPLFVGDGDDFIIDGLGMLKFMNFNFKLRI